MDSPWFCLYFMSLSIYLDSTASRDNELQDMSLAGTGFLSFVFEVRYSKNSLGASFKWQRFLFTFSHLITLQEFTALFHYLTS